MKCSDNSIFRINPVFTLIEIDGEIEVTVMRTKSASKPDKIVIVMTEVCFKRFFQNDFFVQADTEAKEAKEVFKSAPPENCNVLNVPVFTA